MRPLNRLLMAELRQVWGQALAISIVLACGIATYSMSGSTIGSLEESYQRYYREYRFGDLFVGLKRAPNSLANRLREISGVERVEVRVVRDVVLNIPDMVEPATCRLVSLPDLGEPGLNAVYLRQGRMPDPGQRGEVLISEDFAQAHRLRPGDEVTVIMGGKQQGLRVTGIGLSPEYIYAVAPGQMIPDNRHYGVLWMPYRQMAAAFNMEGAFNDAVLKLSPLASADDVMARVDALTKAYGGLGAYTRNDQISHRRVADEIQQLRGMAFVSPTVFLAVAAFLFNLVFSRIVYRRQEEIATLRAFGYKASEIGWHYLKLLLILVTVGLIAGAIGGVLLSRWMVTVYGQFFRFPEIRYVIAWETIGQAAVLSLIVGFSGGLASIARAMRLPPAVAMRPEAPLDYRPSQVERLGLSLFLSPMSLMVLRRLERHWSSTMLSVLGMALGVALVVLGSFMEDTLDYIIDVQFQQAQQQDVTVTFNEALSAAAIYDVAHLPGVLRVEGFRSVPVRLDHGQYSYRTSLMGLEMQPQLFRVLNEDAQPVTIAPEGLTISRKMAEILRLQVGDEVEINVLEGRRERKRVQVMAVFPDYAQPAVYMERNNLHRLLNEGECYSGVFLLTDLQQLEQLHAQLKVTPAVAGVMLKQSALQSFQDTIAENLRPMRLINAAFASTIAFGVIYSCALSALAERRRDLATLRVLGYTRREVTRVLTGELAVITLAALPVGLPSGYLLAWAASMALDTETQRIPLVMSNYTFAYAAVVILIAASVSALIVRGMIDRLDLIAVLKVRE